MIQASRGGVPDAAVELLQQVFMTSRGREGDLRRSFPLAFRSDPRNVCVTWEEDRRVVGAVILRLLSDGGRRIGLLGCIAVAEPHRGKGLGTRLLQEAMQAARQEGAAAGLLWTSQHQFYGRQGWQPVDLCPTRVRRAVASELTAVETRDSGAVHQSVQACGRRSWRTPDDTQALVEMTRHIHFGDVRWWLLQHQGRTVGCAATGDRRHVLELAVAEPAWRGPGVSAVARALGVDEMVCHIGVDDEGEAARMPDGLTMMHALDARCEARHLSDLELSPLDRI